MFCLDKNAERVREIAEQQPEGSLLEEQGQQGAGGAPF